MILSAFWSLRHKLFLYICTKPHFFTLIHCFVSDLNTNHKFQLYCSHLQFSVHISGYNDPMFKLITHVFIHFPFFLPGLF